MRRRRRCPHAMPVTINISRAADGSGTALMSIDRETPTGSIDRETPAEGEARASVGSSIERKVGGLFRTWAATAKVSLRLPPVGWR